MPHVINIEQSYSLRNLSQIMATMFAVTYPSRIGRQGDEPSLRQTKLAYEVTEHYASNESLSGKEYKISSFIIGYIGGKYCSKVKTVTGMDYTPTAGENEPDLEHLKLDFQSDTESHSFYLGDLVKEMPNKRGLNGSKPLIIFMHGFTDDPSKTNFKLISNALQSIEHYNILGLDAGSLIRWLYLRATTYVRYIGDRLGETLAAMTEHGLTSKRIHLIGHSLGAHIAGFAGARFHELTGHKVGRVTGLDPAGPCFADVEEHLRLNYNQAEFVDVIHTNAGTYGISGAGLVGHVDFFPNGGSKQPSCILKTCSHSRAVQLYAESITNQTAFYAVQCRDLDHWYEKKCTEKISIMGHGVTKESRGQFYLRTEGYEPYGLGMNGLHYEKGWFWG